MPTDRASLLHQTVRLSRGSHRRPEDGACVMELASMLAGEPFGDHPQCVSPVIATVLRAYNDLLDDDRRQELLPYASAAVGTRASEELEWARAERLAAWARELREQCSWLRRWWSRSAFELTGLDDVATINRRALELLRRSDERGHEHIVALLDELLAMEEPLKPAPRAATPGDEHAPTPDAALL